MFSSLFAQRLARASSLLLCCMLLTACGSDDPIRPSVPDGATSGDLETEPCTYGRDEHTFDAECGLLIVPENRKSANSRLIALTFTRVLSTSSDPGEPIFFLEGGPGISNAYFSRARYFLDNHDVVLVGYRGVDGSERLECPEVNDFYRDPPGDLFEDVSLDALAQAYSECAERIESEGVDLRGYDVVEVIDDMEAAREALGYDRIHLLSESYGTRLALIYAWMYPERIGRSAMIGVNPPGHFVWQPEALDAQIRTYADLCAADELCSTKTDDLVATMRGVLGNMPERWLIFPVKRANVLTGTFMMLYHTTTAPAGFEAWFNAADGDASGFAALSMLIDYVFPDASVWGESAAKAISADNRYIPEGDFYETFMPPSSIIGAPVSILWGGARGWPSFPIPDSLTAVIASDVDMLLIGGTVDASTPVEAATDELMPHLSNAHQVVLENFGHTADVWGLQPEATEHLLTTYFATGEVDDSKFVVQTVNFDVDWPFALIAKLMVLSVPVIILVLGLIVWLIVRMIRRRKHKRRRLKRPK
jgi:pimeloyl-ACP methyl ester carboxylesterase